MLTNRTKVIVIACLTLCIGITFCVFGYTRIGSLLDLMKTGSKGQAPIRSLRITLDKNQRDELFVQLRSFADKHAFQFYISDYGTGGEAFLVQLSRRDLTILTSLNRRDENVASVGFFAKNPGYSVDEEAIDELLNDLKSYIGEIPNVVIAEE